MSALPSLPLLCVTLAIAFAIVCQPCHCVYMYPAVVLCIAACYVYCKQHVKLGLMPPTQVRKLVSELTLLNLPKLSLQHCRLIARSIGIEYQQAPIAAQLCDIIHTKLRATMAHQTEVSPATGAVNRRSPIRFLHNMKGTSPEQTDQQSRDAIGASGLSKSESASLAL